MALGMKSDISTLNCWARVWLELLLNNLTSLEYFCIWVHDFILKSILYLELICHGACRPQHVNDSTTCSVGVMNWKGKCQPLPKNLWKILFLSSCSPLSSTIQLFFGWKSAETDFGERHQHKQQSLLQLCLIVLSVWKYCNQPPVFCHLKYVRNFESHQTIHNCFDVDDGEVCAGATATSTLNVPPGELSPMHRSTNRSESSPHTDNNGCPTRPQRALNFLLALVKAPQYHPIEAHRHSTNHSAGPITVGLKGSKNGVHQNNRLPKFLV